MMLVGQGKSLKERTVYGSLLVQAHAHYAFPLFSLLLEKCLYVAAIMNRHSNPKITRSCLLRNLIKQKLIPLQLSISHVLRL